MSQITHPRESPADASTLALAAIVYDRGQGREADGLMADLARRLGAEGRRLAGAVQHNTAGDNRRKGDMILEDLTSGQAITISEDRGTGATGCRLDSRALEDLVGLVEAAVDQGADLLIVNRFGDRECEGGGFRGVINKALAAGIPVIVGLKSESLNAWTDYAQGLDTRLAPDLDAALTWCRRACEGERPAAD